MNKYNWENKEKFIADFESSKSICDFLIKNNLTATSGNYKTFTKWYDVHINNITIKKIGQLTFEDIFSVDSKILRKSLKKIIFKHNLIEYSCQNCKNVGIWNNKKLNLQLEHLNGINNDNRLENLAYLCPNCHSQTTTYAGKNRKNKFLKVRLENILKFKELNPQIIAELSLEWNIELTSTYHWIKKNKNELENNDIIINIPCVSKSINKELINKRTQDIKNFLNDDKSYENLFLHLNQLWQIDNSKNWIKRHKQEIEKHNIKIDFPEQKKKIITKQKANNFFKKNILNLERLKNIQEYENNPNAFKILNELWQIDNSKQWIKTNYIEYYEKMNKHNIDTYLKPIEFNVIDLKQRELDLALITHKKEIKILANKWNISINGAKKWIKDNHPERFKEIYDDKHLMKNKKLEAKNEKESYLANLNQDTFVLEEVMKKLNTNKPSIYSLLKKHNPILLEQLQFSVKCIHCSFKTRTSGKNKVGNLFLTRYKCLNPQCRKSFLDKNNHE